MLTQKINSNMKKVIYLTLLISIFSYYSCEHCEITELTVDDPNPMFDCSDLMANIGDPCDDNNPDTSDDAINGNCECIGGGLEFDCPDLMLNVGDACTDNDENTINDTVMDNCECIGESVFDCPELELNIGDPCDDNNPDTQNDMVDANCNCEGEIISDCTGIFFASRITFDGSNITGYFFDSAVKAPGTSVNFNNLEQKSNGFLGASTAFYSNFSAFNPLDNEYAFAYQIDEGVPNPLYLAELDIFNSTFVEAEAYYGAPVFYEGELYAIDVFYDAPNAQYSIVRIDQSTGATTELFADNITVNSPMLKVALTSTVDSEGNLYFLSATNMIIYNVPGNFITYVDIDETYNADNPVAYLGLEYKADEDLLLAIKGKFLTNAQEPELVSISTDGNFSIQSLFNIQDNLGPNNDGQIEFPFYSTAFAQCDNTYYITEIRELEADQAQTFLIQINLNNNSLEENLFQDYFYGLEILEN
jgi:hypothetical protein